MSTDAEEDAKQNNITHKFASTKDATVSEGLEELFRVMQMLLPDELNSFSAARSALVLSVFRACAFAIVTALSLRLLPLSLPIPSTQLHSQPALLCLL